jgi:hypothetical protein
MEGADGREVTYRVVLVEDISWMSGISTWI